jgi:transcriptional regulator with XRE-family HTH domain
MDRASTVVAKQVVAIRKRREWTQADLADRLAEIGYTMTRSVLAKVEAGHRQGVGINDVLALAAALGVSPVHLFIPYERSHQIEITSERRVSALAARRWVHGWSPLPKSDTAEVQQYFSELPSYEWWIQRNFQVRRLGVLFEELALAAEDHPSLRDEADDLYERLAGGVERLLRSIESETANLLKDRS